MKKKPVSVKVAKREISQSCASHSRIQFLSVRYGRDAAVRPASRVRALDVCFGQSRCV